MPKKFNLSLLNLVRILVSSNHVYYIRNHIMISSDQPMWSSNLFQPKFHAIKNWNMKFFPNILIILIIAIFSEYSYFIDDLIIVWFMQALHYPINCIWFLEFNELYSVLAKAPAFPTNQCLVSTSWKVQTCSNFSTNWN